MTNLIAWVRTTALAAVMTKAAPLLKAWSYVRQLVGNGKWATAGIFLFIVLLAAMYTRCSHAAEVDMGAGSSFGTQGYGPTLSLNLKIPFVDNHGLYADFGTDLWGSTTYRGTTVPNNWDWHAELESCHGRFCAGIGPAFVQRVDAINGAHTNYYLGLSFNFTSRLRLVLGHVSDAGTSSPNVGRQLISIQYKMQ